MEYIENNLDGLALRMEKGGRKWILDLVNKKKLFEKKSVSL
jgi:hypothetical protein